MRHDAFVVRAEVGDGFGGFVGALQDARRVLANQACAFRRFVRGRFDVQAERRGAQRERTAVARIRGEREGIAPVFGNHVRHVALEAREPLSLPCAACPDTPGRLRD